LPHIRAGQDRLSLAGGPFCSGGLGLELGHIQDDDFAALEANEASVDKPPEITRNQITDRANLRPNLLVGFFQGKLDATSCADP
jgi:hypothetical protein